MPRNDIKWTVAALAVTFVVGLVAIGTIAIVPPWGEQVEPAPTVDLADVIVQVGDDYILKSQWDDRIIEWNQTKELAAKYDTSEGEPADEKQVGRMLILGMVEGSAASQYAEALGFTATEEEVREANRVQREYCESQPPCTQLRREVAARLGMTLEELYDLVEQETPNDLARNKMWDALEKGNTPYERHISISALRQKIRAETTIIWYDRKLKDIYDTALAYYNLEDARMLTMLAEDEANIYRPPQCSDDEVLQLKPIPKGDTSGPAPAPEVECTPFSELPESAQEWYRKQTPTPNE